MNAPTNMRAKTRYPNRTKIKAVVPVLVETARELGIDVTGIEVSADGTIRVIESRGPVSNAGNVFDRFEDQL